MMAESQKKMYELVAEKIIEQLEAGIAPWQKPWNPAGTDFSMPYNAVTGKSYKGLNSLCLHLFSPFDDPRFATFKQAAGEGWEVKKGSKGFLINFVKQYDLRKKVDENGKPMVDTQGRPIMITVKYDSPIITKAWVFNGQQIKGIPPLHNREGIEVPLWEKVARAEKIVNASEIEIEHVKGDQAYYNCLYDRITMPEKHQFESADRYYSTLLHEMGHATGHHSRLNRELANSFGTAEYAREELRAEIASMIIGGELSLGHDPGQHISYVDSWIKILNDTPYEIHSACADAQRITDYVLDFEHKKELKVEASIYKDINTLIFGDTIRYQNATYQVIRSDKKDFIIENLNNGQKIQFTSNDNIFHSLMEAKNNPTELPLNIEGTQFFQNQNNESVEMQTRNTYKI